MCIRSTCAWALLLVGGRLAAQGGGLDPAFGGSGVVRFSYQDGDDLRGMHLALTSDGTIITASAMYGASEGRVLVSAFTPDGSPSPLFGESAAYSIVDTGVLLEAVGLVVTAQDAVIVCCNGETPLGGSILLVKLLADGTPDMSFGPGGRRWLHPLEGWVYRAGALALDQEERILIGGSGTLSGGDTQAMLSRYLPDGTTDPSFGDAGMVLAGMGQLGPGYFREHIQAVAVNGNGKIVVTGRAEVPVNPGWRAFKARFADDGGQLSYQGPYFGWGSGPSHANSLALAPNGDAVIIGTGDQGAAHMAYGRYEHDGEEVATGFVPLTGHGAITSEGRSVAIDDDGRILITGTAADAEGTQGMVLARLLGDCDADADFGTAGSVFHSVGTEGWSEANDLVVQADGRIVLVGSSMHEGHKELTLMRFLPSDGTDVPEQGSAAALGIHPNPATDVFTVLFNGNGPTTTVELVDMMGRALFEERPDATYGPARHMVQLPSGLASGNYLVRLTDNSGVRTGRLIVQ